MQRSAIVERTDQTGSTYCEKTPSIEAYSFVNAAMHTVARGDYGLSWHRWSYFRVEV